MHAFKGGWVGQTFALATPNDSGGKKARIRRSKEERKSMVETFIKKYQKSNNGNFPSLNLTHKEVGGSFYTVREIVRDIIQENRVLGPSKLPLQEQNVDNLLQHYPLGSISVDPELCLSPLNDTEITSHVTQDQNQGTSEELSESSNVPVHQAKHQTLDIRQQDSGAIDHADDCTSFEKSSDIEGASPIEGTIEVQQRNLTGQLLTSEAQKFDDDLVGKGTETAAEDEVSYAPELGTVVSVHGENSFEGIHESTEDQALHLDREIPGDGLLSSKQQAIVNGTTQVAEKNDVKKSERVELESSNTDRTLVKPDIQVEKFPLRPVAKNINIMNEALEVQPTKALEVNGNEKVRLHVSNGSSVLGNPEVGGHAASRIVKGSEGVDEASYLNFKDPSSESSHSSPTKESAAFAINNVAELGAKGSSSIETKPASSSTPFSGNVNDIADKKSTSKTTSGVKYKLNIEHKSGSEEGIESRFERINQYVFLSPVTFSWKLPAIVF
ncbi:OLC1v1026196C1 [Oldenlandia corymbosa var. corymbosa]|uniref:OLC1v1026196C1 n=1 Tax=Oldenlandia corymbosa var. corymbosa TaxID=529605 RepID=A0AAV1C6H1_OLDCO|nr:OLC1v1026196C1 [Oldenlandia corymbosa var. corymbosa]